MFPGRRYAARSAKSSALRSRVAGCGSFFKIKSRSVAEQLCATVRPPFAAKIIRQSVPQTGSGNNSNFGEGGRPGGPEELCGTGALACAAGKNTARPALSEANGMAVPQNQEPLTRPHTSATLSQKWERAWILWAYAQSHGSRAWAKVCRPSGAQEPSDSWLLTSVFRLPPLYCTVTVTVAVVRPN